MYPSPAPTSKAGEVFSLAPQFRQASKAIASFVTILGLVALYGWVFNLDALTTAGHEFGPMKFNTAVLFVCLGTALWLAGDDKRRQIRSILALLVVVVAGLTSAEYTFGINLGIDQILFRDTHPVTAYPGRMAIASAHCFIVLGLAVLLLDIRKARVLQRATVAACLALGLAALSSYLYGVQSLYAITSFSTATHTAIGLMLASLAYFLARPDEGVMKIAASDTNAGFLLRTLIPTVAVVPVILGELMVVGERANLYDAQFGVAILVLTNIGCLGVLTLVIVRSSHRFEREQREAEKTLRESEERFRLVADTTPAMIWMSGVDRLCTYFNQGWLEFTGRPLEAEVGNGWVGGVHPEDFERCLETYTRAFDLRESFRMEYRLRRHDGEYRWIFDHGVPRFNLDNSFAGYIGSCIDVTERKLAEEALSGVGQKLIAAQEEERTRIARELHDDINQRLAAVSVNLGRSKNSLPASAVELKQTIGEASEGLRDVANDIQALSHRLHSSKLEILGLAAAAKGFCRELSDRQNVRIDFESENIPEGLPQEISLCLFRVLQEALQNATKHSGTDQFRVSLKSGARGMELTVRDSGLGFDPEEEIKGRGLGLISMKERLKLVNGVLSIESKLGRGTTIEARVPYSSEIQSSLSCFTRDLRADSVGGQSKS